MHYQNLTLAFSDDPDHKNTSFRLIGQQLWILLKKRTRILYRRYVIAICTLLLPLVLEAVLSAIIPSSANIISDAFNSVFGLRNIPPFTYDVYKYGSQAVPVRINETGLDKFFVDYIDKQAVLGNKPRNTLK